MERGKCGSKTEERKIKRREHGDKNPIKKNIKNKQNQKNEQNRQ